MQKPIRCVRFTKAIASHADIRDQNPSLGYICPGEPHERSPNVPKFEDRSQEETEWQEQGAREAAWKLAKSALKLKEQERATFFSPSENRCLPESTLKPEEREFVVDSGASMHMISKKVLSDAELETVTTSRSPTTRTTSSSQCTTSTPMTTLTLTIAWCTSCIELAHSAHCSTLDDDTAHLMGQVLSNHIVISIPSMARPL